MVRSLVLVVALVLAACPPPAPPPVVVTQQCPARSSGPCRSDRDCPALGSTAAFCDKEGDSATGTGDGIAREVDAEGCCFVVDLCTSPRDCVNGASCDLRRGRCVQQLCDPSAENGGGCPQDDGTIADCCPVGDQCEIDDGQPFCVENPPAATKCAVVVDHRPVATDVGDTEAAPAVAISGRAVHLGAVGTDDNGQLVAHASFTWSVDRAGAVVDGDGVFVASCTAVAGACAFTVIATAPGGVTCEGVVEVLAPATTPRVVLIDADTGERLGGVDAVAIVDGVPVTDVTADDGVVSFAGASVADVDALSLFPADHDWQTLVAPALLDDTGDFIVATRKTPSADVVAGISGTFNFDNVHTTGDMKLGIAGLAITDVVDDMPRGPASLFAPSFDRLVNLEGITDEDGDLVAMPMNTVIELGNEPIQGDFVALSRRTGPNIAWAIGGQVALADVGPIISGLAGGGDVNVGNIMNGVLPFFARFDHAVITGVDLTSRLRPGCDNGAFTCDHVDLDGAPTACDAGAGVCVTADGKRAPIDTAAWAIDNKELNPNTLLLESADYAVPLLPAGTAGVVVVAGADTAGAGLVPLGITAGLDDPDDQDAIDQTDGLVDTKDPNGPAKGHVVVNYAPEHDGLEGAPLETIAFAVALDPAAGDDAAHGMSALVHRAKHFDADNAFPAGAFLAIPALTVDDAGAVTLTAGDDAADLARVRLGGDGGSWNVWLPRGAAAFLTRDLGAPDDTRQAAAAALLLRLGEGNRAADALVDVGRAVDAWATSAPATVARP